MNAQNPAYRRYRRRTVRVLVDYTTETGPRCDLATTLGAGGLFVETDDPSCEATSLKLRFQLPGSETPHEIEGRVVWTRRPEPGDLHAPGMGIEFTDRVASARLAADLKDLEPAPKELPRSGSGHVDGSGEA